MGALQLERGVVIGGGIGGIAAAAALRGACAEIVVLERDPVLAGMVARRGVPQSHHLHNLLSRAQLDLEDLLPGFLDALRATGCGDASVGDETEVFELGAVMPARRLGLRILSARRVVIESVARAELQRGGGIKMRTAAGDGLVLRSGGEVAAVRLTDGSVVECDLAVDATGAASRLPVWLRALGRPNPPVVEAAPDQWYVTIELRRPVGLVGDHRFWMSFPSRTEHRGALLSPIDDAHWMLSLNGRTADEPPTTWTDVRAVAASLADSRIAEAIDGALPVGSPHRYRKLTTRWLRYDRLENPVPGLLPLGDAVAALNPLFGQGMSVVAQQAVALRRHLRVARDLEDLTLCHHRSVGQAIAGAWDLGSLLDDAFGDLARAEAMAQQLEKDGDLHRRYVEVWHLLRPASTVTDERFLAELDTSVRSRR